MANKDPDNIDENELDFGNEMDGEADPNVLAELAAGDEDEGEGEGTNNANTNSSTEEDDEGDDAGQQQQARTVPHARFHEVNERLKAEREQRIRLEERLRALEERTTTASQQQQQREAAPAFDLKAAIKERNAALLEGDDEKVAEIELKIEEHRMAEAERRAEAKLAERLSQREQNEAATALQRKAAEIVAEYPFLDSNADDADAELISDVKDLRDVYIARGKNPAEALVAAVQKLKPQLDAKAGKAPAKTPEQLAAERRAATVTRNATVAGKQPPRNVGVGQAGVPDVPDVMGMSADDWDKLPEAERNKLLA